MMHIPYLAPEQDPNVVDQANLLVQKMTNLIKLLTNPKTKYRLLTPDDRQKLIYNKFPASLVNNLAFYTARVRQANNGRFVSSDQQMIGFTSAAFRTELYASDAIKSHLIKTQCGRCAYCETLIQQSEYGDVEHFRPKAAFSNPWSTTLFRPGYFRLAYDPQNLFYSCTLCNQAYKKNYFEVVGDNQIYAPSEEKAILINPYLEDPRNYIRFNPLNGRAYPFDLVAEFYLQTQGWSSDRTSQELWSNPTKIPGQNTPDAVATSQFEVDAAFQLWLQSVQDPKLRRGNSTIVALGLNRRSLVRSRIGHLRHMRGLLCTTQVPGADSAAANQFVKAMLESPQTQTQITPQYTSLSIDALQTWNAEGIPGTLPWVESYDRILNQLHEEPLQPTPEPYNDAFCYMLFENDLSKAGQRRLVYISDSDKVYGNPMGRKAITLAVDWDSEQNNTILFKRGEKTMRRMTMRQLLEESHNNPQIYRLFQHNEAWVLGNFPPFNS